MSRSELLLSPACVGERMVVQETLAMQPPAGGLDSGYPVAIQAIHSYLGDPAEIATGCCGLPGGAEMMQCG